MSEPLSGNEPKRSLFERLSALLLRAPEDREQLLSLLRASHDRELLDTLRKGQGSTAKTG